jgi:hypothetical protein
MRHRIQSITRIHSATSARTPALRSQSAPIGTNFPEANTSPESCESGAGRWQLRCHAAVPESAHAAVARPAAVLAPRPLGANPSSQPKCCVECVPRCRRRPRRLCAVIAGMAAAHALLRWILVELHCMRARQPRGGSCSAPCHCCRVRMTWLPPPGGAARPHL